MEDILDFEEQLLNENQNFVEASKSKRFANYIIDTFAYYLFALVIGLLIGVVQLYFGYDFFGEDSNSIVSKLSDWILGGIIVLLYYTLFEYYSKGKSLGKLITRTRAITLDNQAISFETALKRSAARIIPFEPFSYLGENTGWHDNIAGTKVIEDKDWRG